MKASHGSIGVRLRKLRCEDVPFDFDEEGHRMELQFETVKRVKVGEEHRWTALVEGEKGFPVEKAEQADTIRQEREQAQQEH